MTTLSTTVAELYAFMKCFGTCQFLRGPWMDLTGEVAPIHMRTDANNLVTTASTTHLPEQEETIHMIQMLRTEACSGAIQDLAHVRTEHCLADSLTKHSVNPESLIKTVETGVLTAVDCHPLFRTTLAHKAFSASPTGTHDFWKREENRLIRYHHVPRRRRYVPRGQDGCPVGIQSLQPVRHTFMAWGNGEHEVHTDSWLSSSETCTSIWT